MFNLRRGTASVTPPARRSSSRMPRLSLVAAAAMVVAAVAFTPRAPVLAAGKVHALGAENEYANVISQIGGRYVSVSSILQNPNTDPHTYEANTADAALVAGASLIVQNGLGYDTFMNNLEAASPNPRRLVIVAAKVLRSPSGTRNPHLWYKPATMSRVAGVVARDLSHLEPQHAAYFARNLKRFDRSLAGWATDVTRLRRAYHGTAVAVTEPVADYLLLAAGLNIRTPWAFQAAIMNGTDPSPQDVATETRLLSKRLVKVFVYNQQAVDTITQRLLRVAKRSSIPVVGVYETMPPRHTYQSWMEQETNALYQAIRHHRSEVTMP